jgi:hypothetical protein
MTAEVNINVRPSRMAALMHTIWSLIFGTLLCLTPVTSIIALGWIMRRMRVVALRRVGLDTRSPNWILGNKYGKFDRFVGGLARNIREGFMAAFSLLFATLPFTAIWALGWWAGWENSFGKGYEQALVGPAISLIGVAVFCCIMVWLPMAVAHQAVECRAFSLFEYRQVRSAVRHSGWGYLLLAVATVIFALPIFAGRGLITFASGIVPGFDTMSAVQISDLSNMIILAKAAYAFTALVILRGWAARTYAGAVARALSGPESELWHNSALANGSKGGSRPWRLTHWMRLVILVVIWFALAAQIYIAQFLNYDWYVWLTHPFFLLPWSG